MTYMYLYVIKFWTVSKPFYLLRLIFTWLSLTLQQYTYCVCLHSQHDSKTESRTKILRRGVYSKTCCSTIHTIVNNCRHSLTPHNYSIIPVLGGRSYILFTYNTSFFIHKNIQKKHKKTNREHSTHNNSYCSIATDT